MDQERQIINYNLYLAQESLRFEDMIIYIKKLVTLEPNLSLNETNYLTNAYKSVVEDRRHSLRILKHIEENKSLPCFEALFDENKFKNYIKIIEVEIEEICKDILELLNEYLIPFACSPESKVLYYKLIGDYYRYMAEIATEDTERKVKNNCLNYYNAAFNISTGELSPAHPYHIGLALNFSVFYYDILKYYDIAMHMAECVYREADNELDKDSSFDYFEDSTKLLELLKENIQLWESDLHRSDG